MKSSREPDIATWLIWLAKVVLHSLPLIAAQQGRYVLAIAAVLFVLSPYIKYFKFTQMARDPRYKDDAVVLKQRRFWIRFTFLKNEL